MGKYVVKKNSMPNTYLEQRTETSSLLISWLTFILVRHNILILIIYFNKIKTRVY